MVGFKDGLVVAGLTDVARGNAAAAGSKFVPSHRLLVLVWRTVELSR